LRGAFGHAQIHSRKHAYVGQLFSATSQSQGSNIFSSEKRLELCMKHFSSPLTSFKEKMPFSERGVRAMGWENHRQQVSRWKLLTRVKVADPSFR